jgi:soluble lytic murein transglycosylase-like protein
MDRGLAALMAFGIVGLLALFASRRAEAASDDLSYYYDEPYSIPMDVFSVEVPEQYRQAISDAAAQYGVPPDTLARLLWQESRFREDIIFCQTLSSAGAQGIAQFMPATAADVANQIGYFDPCEPYGSIIAASYYLFTLYRQTGNWLDAVAAYNWGIGNVMQFRSGADMTVPQETRDYTAAILGQTFA